MTQYIFCGGTDIIRFHAKALAVHFLRRYSQNPLSRVRTRATLPAALLTEFILARPHVLHIAPTSEQQASDCYRLLRMSPAPRADFCQKLYRPSYGGGAALRFVARRRETTRHARMLMIR